MLNPANELPFEYLPQVPEFDGGRTSVVFRHIIEMTGERLALEADGILASDSPIQNSRPSHRSAFRDHQGMLPNTVYLRGNAPAQSSPGSRSGKFVQEGISA